MSVPQSCSRITLAERPKEHITPSTFKKEHAQVKQPGEKQVLVRVEYVSIDPAMRGWIKDSRSYIEPVKIGATMRAYGLGTVLAAGPGSKFQVGDTVNGDLGWCDYTVLDDKPLQKVNLAPKTELLDYLGILGGVGLTAYFGIFDVAHIKAGDTLLVSGAAGAVGSIVCQLGKLLGAKVIGIAGSQSKCEYLTTELGCDLALNYKDKDWKKVFREKVGYVDVYFDNVGGEMLDFVLTRLNVGARIALCGAISDYNQAKPKGLSNYLSLIGMRAKMEGFVVLDYVQCFPEAKAKMAGWIAEGKLKMRFTVVEGLEKGPEALGMLFTGGNTGKLVLKIAGDKSKSKL